MIKHGNRWQISYRCPGYPGTFTESFDTEEDAKLREAQIAVERKNGTLKPPAKRLLKGTDISTPESFLSVADMMSYLLNEYGPKEWAPNTYSSNAHRIQHYIIPYIGNLPITALTPAILEKFYSKLLKEPAIKLKGREHEEKRISPGVIEKVHSLIRLGYNEAMRLGQVAGPNPANNVRLPKKPKKPKRPTWEKRHIQKALPACDDETLAICLRLAVGCSLRIGEILGLTWSNVHIDNLPEDEAPYIFINHELERIDKSFYDRLKSVQREDMIHLVFPSYIKRECKTLLVLKAPKTESSVRKVYLPASLIPMLREIWEKQEYLRGELGDGYQDFGLVVAQNNGRPYERDTIRNRLNMLAEKNDLPSIVFHSLRHSSVTLKLNLSHGDIKSVQGDTGHAQADMVTQTYAEIVDKNRKDLARKIDAEVLSPTAPQPTASETTNDMLELLSSLNASPDKAATILQLLKNLMS